MVTNKNNAFGKAKPTQAPTFQSPNAERQVYGEDPVYRKEPVQSEGHGTLILSIICLVCVIGFSGLGVLHFLKSPQQVQAIQPTKNLPKIDGTNQFAKKQKSCENRLLRGVSKKDKEFQAALKQAMRTTGYGNMGGKPRLILCLSEAPRQYFCNNEFRQKFNTYVTEIQTSVLATNSAMQDMQTMQLTIERLGKKSKPNIDYFKTAQRKIRSLFKSGHLRREDFSSSMFGEPKWLKQVFVNIQSVPSPC